jgi:hypothetical protein
VSSKHMCTTTVDTSMPPGAPALLWRAGRRSILGGGGRASVPPFIGEDGRTQEDTRMPRHGPQCTQEQRRKRRQRNEHAFLFTPAGHLLHEVERLTWEIALADCGGDVATAAAACGLTDIPKGTKALWGRSAAEAWATYRRWQKQHSRP